MAYRREVVLRTRLLGWQQLTLQSADRAWSEPYRVEGSRLLMPLSSCFSCELGSARFVCDPAAGVWLTPAMPDRVRRPWVAQRSALLLVEADLGPARRAALPRSTQLLLGLWRRGLATGELDALGVEERIASLLDDALSTDNAVASRPHRAVERAREYVASAPERNDTLAEIAWSAHCSAFHLARTFRARTGQTLHGLRTRLRMAQSIARLADGESDLNALAADLGYSSHSHFSAVFRRSFGLSPAKVRTNLTAAGRLIGKTRQLMT